MPVALVADAIKDCSRRGGLVLDPFCGSGTILIAAERTGRKARALEIDPTYEVRRRLYEREAVPVPPPRRRGFSAVMLIGGLAIAAAFIAVLIVMFATFVEPFWQSTNAQLRPSDRPTANKAPAGSITGMAAVSGAQQPSRVQAQPAQFSAFARHFEENPVQGVTENEIRFGISAPFSGAAKELGQNMKLGIDAAFHVANAKGGVHGRQLRLVVADDGYEPSRTVETMKQLYEQDRIFGVVGNVGTPTAVVALPYALDRKMLFFGAFTGAGRNCEFPSGSP